MYSLFFGVVQIIGESRFLFCLYSFRCVRAGLFFVGVCVCVCFFRPRRLL